MSDLAPEDRAVLDLARSGHDPTDADRRRVRAALAAQLGAAAGLAVTTTSTASAGAGAGAAGTVIAGATATVAVKVAAMVAIVGAVASGGVATYRATHAPPPKVVVAPAAVVTPSRVTRLAETGDLPTAVAAPTPFSPLPWTARGPTFPATPTSPGQSAPPPSFLAPLAPPTVPATLEATTRAAPADDPPSSALEAETRLVRAGLTALHAGDPASALAQFDRHAREFPGGLLAPERDAERIFALCDLRRYDEARAAADDFRVRHPSSPLLARVRSSCAFPSNP